MIFEETSEDLFIKRIECSSAKMFKLLEACCEGKLLILRKFPKSGISRSISEVAKIWELFIVTG